MSKDCADTDGAKTNARLSNSGVLFILPKFSIPLPPKDVRELRRELDYNLFPARLLAVLRRDAGGLTYFPHSFGAGSHADRKTDRREISNIGQKARP
jgi:hypothetical protein